LSVSPYSLFSFHYSSYSNERFSIFSLNEKREYGETPSGITGITETKRDNMGKRSME
jgi:hypothetical protein